MIKRKVLAVLITKDIIEPECMQSVLDQDYPAFSVMIHIQKAIKYFNSDDKKKESFVNQYINCPDNRNKARTLALASDANYFLFVDSDTVLPKNALSLMTLHKKDILGGYYKMHSGSDTYVAGGFMDVEGKSVFVHCKSVLPGIVKVDMIGMGCALISRKALTDLEFEDGLDMSIQVPGKDGQPMSVGMGECMVFGHRAKQKGYELFMHGEVECKHLTRSDHYSTIVQVDKPESLPVESTLGE